jgi:hypothetical protein
VTPRSAQAWLSEIASAFTARGWRDDDFAALRIVDALRLHGSYDRVVAEAVVPPNFIERNQISDTNDVLDAVADAVGRWTFLPDTTESPAIIPIDEIDSFARVREVTPQSVAGISAPLDIAEAYVKQAITNIIGEPHTDKDWGGEAGDVFTSHVYLHGARTAAAFLLKGPGLRGVMRPKSLGKNGDQLVRLFTLPADLYVVQFVGRIDPSVTEMLRRFVLSRRSEGRPQAVGSVWEGTDSARLLVAHGLIDATTGRTIAPSEERATRAEAE